ncbi:hypothetical protein BJY04DRAFT_220407 [Aspergillus karnatakaensis]|uniref:DUF3176 domain-containing protein n=1 Tax=Aspergillus karnatakaensis TaxID=1810916 RepID=UPI003CCDD637
MSRQEKQTSRWLRLSLDTWLWEVIAIVSSLPFFIAILTLLFVCDQKQSPKLPSGITLNTIVSILSTASKSSLIFAMSSAIGQLKWISFRKERAPLYDLQLADDAGRGPLGSFLILLRYKGRAVVCVGAAVIVLGLAFEPFMQQIISYPIRQTPSADLHASVKRAQYPLFYNAAFDIIDAAMAGVWSENFETSPICPSGNCTFAPYRSTGWCSKCEDATSQARLVGCSTDDNATLFTRSECRVVLPHGNSSLTTNDLKSVQDRARLGIMSVPGSLMWAVSNPFAPEDTINTTIAGVKSPSTVFAHAELVIPTFSNGTYYATAKELKIRRVTQCVLTPCSRQYTVSVTQGVPTVNVSAPDYGEDFQRGDGRYCWKPTQTGRPAHTSNLTYTELYNSNVSYIDTRETPLVSAAQSVICPVSIIPEGLSSWPFSAIWLDYKRTNPQKPQLLERIDGRWESEVSFRALRVGLESIVRNIAASLTKVGLEHANDTVYGAVYITEVYVQVTWAFIALPTALIVMGTFFLVLTILISSRQDVGLWKTSILPAFYHGLDNGMLGDRDYEAMSAMDRAGTFTNVELILPQGEKRLRLVA